MASVPLVDTYRRYKVGTDKFIRWLLEAGERCSPTFPKPTATSTASKTTVDDLLPLATRIAASTEPRIDITLELLDILRDVITGRQLCADWYAALAKQGESENDKTHRYFLDVLKQIYDVLQKEHKSRRPKRKKKMPQLPTDTGDLANLFQHLGLELTAKESSETGSALSDKTPKAKQPTVKPKLEDSKHEQEEMISQIYSENQKRFVDGKTSFMAVAQATDDAMHVSASITGQFREEYPELETFDDIIKLLGVERFQETANRAQYSENLESSWEEGNKEAELLCVDGWTVVTTAKARLAVKLVKQAPEGSTHLSGDLFPGPGTPLHPLSEVFISAFTEFESLRRLNQYDLSLESLVRLSSCADIYTFGLYNFFLRVIVGGADIAVVLLTALYCDLHDALKGNMEAGFNICSTLIAHQSSEMVDQLETFFKKELEIPWQEVPNLMEWLRTGQDLVVPHTTENGVEGWLYEKIGEDTRSFIPRTLLEMFPLLAASLARQSCEEWEHLGVEVCNWKHIVLSAAHLHKALAIGYHAKPWSDLDFLMQAQDRSCKSLLRPNEANVIVDIVFKEYALALGFTITQVSGTQKPTLKPSANAKYPNAPQLQSAIRSTKEKDETALMYKRLDLTPRPGDLSPFYGAIRKYHSTTGIQDVEISRQWTQTKKLSTSQLLQVLHEVALHEEQFAYFDYLNFFIQCLKLLNFACKTYCIDLKARRKSQKPSRGLWFFEIVFEVLSEAAKDHKRGLNREKSILGDIAEYFDGVVTRDGGKSADISRAEIQRQIDVGQATRRASSRSKQEVKEIATIWNNFLAAIREGSLRMDSDTYLEDLAAVYRKKRL